MIPINTNRLQTIINHIEFWDSLVLETIKIKKTNVIDGMKNIRDYVDDGTFDEPSIEEEIYSKITLDANSIVIW